jgi:predicted acylesterase/phospholipase RssA
MARKIVLTGGVMGSTSEFDTVFAKELEAIGERRRFHANGDTAGAGPDERARTPPVGDDLIGLALSGGGIRSAAFCLGALQALSKLNAIRVIDYLSTVSGGGYVGGAMTATMRGNGKFAFGYPPDSAAPTAPKDMQHNRNEPPAMRHRRGDIPRPVRGNRRAGRRIPLPLV